MAKQLSGELLRGSLDLMILSTLSDGAMYGYSIQKRLAEASKEAVQLQAGTLYPILHRLESEKLIRSRWEKSTGSVRASPIERKNPTGDRRNPRSMTQSIIAMPIGQR